MLFYRGVKYELAPIRPVSKFLTVKAVVFLTYWQGVAIAILVWARVIRTKARRRLWHPSPARPANHVLLNVPFALPLVWHRRRQCT